MSFLICTDKNKWDTFVGESSQGNVFCCTDFLDALPVAYELITLTEYNKIVLGAIVLHCNSDVIKAPYPMTMYQGILCHSRLEELPSHKYSKWLQEHLTSLFVEIESRFPRISFCLFHQFNDLRPFQWFHFHEPNRGMFKIELKYTGILDLAEFSDFEAYLGAIRTVRRQEFRKALGDGFVIEVSDDIDMLNRLHRKTFERQGLVREREDERLLASIAGAALAKGFGELLVCRDRDGNAASMTLFLYDRRYGYYLVGANDPAYRKSGAGTMLMLESIRRCWDKGLAAVDFVGINSPNRGDFKTSFNAKPTPYFVVDYPNLRT